MSGGPVHHPPSGGCLCGGVRYEVHGPTRSVVFCHCRLCRVQGSNATVGMSRSTFRLIDWKSLRSYHSSAEARRWFCGLCGAAIYWDPIGQPFVAVFAGSLDQPTGLTAVAHIYTAERPDYVHVADGLRQYPGPMYPSLGTAEDHLTQVGRGTETTAIVSDAELDEEEEDTRVQSEKRPADEQCRGTA